MGQLRIEDGADCTRVVQIGNEVAAAGALAQRIKLRTMIDDEWIDRFASGTLRKNKRLGFSWRAQYIHERIAFEFGWLFECIPRSRIMWGAPITEGDCKPVTEAGWHIDRYFSMSIFPEDLFEAKYINVADGDGQPAREGVGIIVRQTSVPWIPTGHVVFAIVTQFDKQAGAFKPAGNPC